MKCSARVSIDSWHYASCGNKAKISRDGKAYCGVHDPERLDALSKAREAKKPKCGKCKALTKRWGANCPYCGTKILKEDLK